MRSPKATFLGHRAMGKEGVGLEHPCPCRAGATGTSVMSWPPTWTLPESGISKPAIMRSDVVLPQPDGPSSEKNSPALMSSVTASTAVTLPSNVLVTWSSLIAADVIQTPHPEEAAQQPSRRVGNEHLFRCPSFETRPSGPLLRMRFLRIISSSKSWSRARRCLPCVRCTISSRAGSASPPWPAW